MFSQFNLSSSGKSRVRHFAHTVELDGAGPRMLPGVPGRTTKFFKEPVSTGTPLRLAFLLRIGWGEGGRRPDEVSAGEWEEAQGDKSKHSRLSTLDLGLCIQQNCTISAPFLHRFSHLSRTRLLIINDLQNFLHRDTFVTPSVSLSSSTELRAEPRGTQKANWAGVRSRIRAWDKKSLSSPNPPETCSTSCSTTASHTMSSPRS